eukprot:767918-Hanusia_phi.AAC.2
MRWTRKGSALRGMSTRDRRARVLLLPSLQMSQRARHVSLMTGKRARRGPHLLGQNGSPTREAAGHGRSSRARADVLASPRKLFEAKSWTLSPLGKKFTGKPKSVCAEPEEVVEEEKQQDKQEEEQVRQQEQKPEKEEEQEQEQEEQEQDVAQRLPSRISHPVEIVFGLESAFPFPLPVSPELRRDGAASWSEEDRKSSDSGKAEGPEGQQEESFHEVSLEDTMAAAARAMNILDLHILRSHRQRHQVEGMSPSDRGWEEGGEGSRVEGILERGTGGAAGEHQDDQEDWEEKEREGREEEEDEEIEESFSAAGQDELRVHEEGYDGGNSSNEEENSSGGDEFEHVSKREALWTDCNLEELKELDERSWEIVSSLRQIPVATLQVEAEQRLSGPVRSSSSRGQKSVMLHVLNCTTLTLSLQRYGGEQTRWAILPPPEILPGEEIVMASESLGGLLSSPSAEVAYGLVDGGRGGGGGAGGRRGGGGEGSFGSVEFYMRWDFSISGRVLFSSSASPGWHVEREYLNGNSGSHATSRFFLLRTPCPPRFIALQESFRMGHKQQRKEPSSPPRQPPLNLLLLDCDLHAGLRCTRERTRHIISWLHRCSFPLSGLEKEGNLDLLVLLGVHAEAARLELLKSFSTPLGLAHVVAEVGCRSLGLTGDSGILLASKFPVLSHRFSSFPAHDGCSHPALNLPKGNYGGLLAVLLDFSRRRAGDKVVVFVSTVPNQEVVWKAMRKAMLSFLSSCKLPTSTVAALLVGKFEGVPFLSKGMDVRERTGGEADAGKNHLFLPVMELRDLLMDPKPSEEGGRGLQTFGGLGEAVTRSLAVGEEGGGGRANLTSLPRNVQQCKVSKDMGPNVQLAGCTCCREEVASPSSILASG